MAKMLIEKQEIISAAIDGTETPGKTSIPPLALFGKPTTREVSFKRISKIAALIDSRQIPSIVLALSTVHDRNIEKLTDPSVGPSGFSRNDREIAKSLLGYDDLTTRQAALALVLCFRYRRQIPKELLAKALGQVPEEFVRTKRAP